MRLLFVVRRRRGESGAVAVMVALLAVLLLTMGALTVDIGNAYVHKRDMQKRADFSALAGGVGDDLPMTAAGTNCSYGVSARATDQAIIDVADYLSTHYDTTVTPAQLVDCDFTNGEADYGTFSWSQASGWSLAPNKNQIGVVSQANRVDFGMAGILGFKSVNVNGVATVEIKSPLMKTLPFYAKDGCSWGNQTISQPPNGQADGLFLFAPSDTNSAVLTSPLVTNPSSNPATVPLGASSTTSPNDSLVINGNNLTGATEVGFFQSGTLSTGPDPDGTPNTTTSTFTNTGTRITIAHMPTTVTSVEGQWYVRVKIGGQWSPVTVGNGNNAVLNALPLVVGQPTLTCGQGSDQGNFGTLDLPPSNPPATGLSGNDANQQIAYNIINGLTSTLAPFDTDKLLPPDYTCTGATIGAVLWDGAGTNCVLPQPGVPSNAAEEGFVLGINSSYPKGLLEDTDPKHFCPNDSPTGTNHLGTLRGQSVNNDVLSCYFTNDASTIAAAATWCPGGAITVGCVTSKSYAGPPVIDQSIYLSPRFVSVPILQFVGNGSSKKYQILGFRPGFITDQPATATRATGVPIATSGCGSNSNNWTGECNGIQYNNGQLRAVNVVFINQAALPDPPLDPAGRYIPFTGSGPKVPLLVN